MVGVGDSVLLGISGWSYAEWEGSFYQKGEKRKLRAYSRIFNGQWLAPLEAACEGFCLCTCLLFCGDVGVE